MNISIVGSGNIGTALAVDLATDNQVRIFSTKPYLFGKHLTMIDTETGDEKTSSISIVTDSYKKAVYESEIIFITVPTFMVKRTIEAIKPYVSENAIIGFVPGAGGVEYIAKDLIKEGKVIFGFERVPYVARLLEYGKRVSASKKSGFRVAAMPQSKTGDISLTIEKLLDRPCVPMDEFVAMTLTPSLHGARLFDLYKNYAIGDQLDYNPLFYGEWTNSASILTFELDDELHSVCNALTENGISADEVIPYRIHYESKTPEELTKKLKSIRSLNRITGPLKQLTNGKYELDIKSRYFTESYPYRLCIVKGIAELLSIHVPKTDEVLNWYCNLASKMYYKDGRFCGDDIVECNIPQNYGIMNIDGLRDFYNSI